jgi:predicted DNA binding CopG/RHH family protein
MKRFDRVSPNDLKRLKVRAMEDGMPYQTLVSSIIHKYVTGRLTEQRKRC